MKKNLRLTFFLSFLLFLFINTSGQNRIIPFFSGGAMHHLGRYGANFELGAEYEMTKHLGISTNYRSSFLSNQFNEKVVINAIALNLSWIVINRKSNRLSISTGINTGYYYSISFNSYDIRNPQYEKDYFDVWWNPAKIQYDYTFSNNVLVGTYLGLYKDDGDYSNLIGFVIGYKL